MYTIILFNFYQFYELINLTTQKPKSYYNYLAFEINSDRFLDLVLFIAVEPCKTVNF